MTLMEDSLLLLASHVWYGSVRRTVTCYCYRPYMQLNQLSLKVITKVRFCIRDDLLQDFQGFWIGSQALDTG